MRLSVIVPVLDEAQRIDSCLAALARQPGIAERIVVDGGSRDDTLARARATPGTIVAAAARGRGSQLNAGARCATGDVLLFLHADVDLPAEAAAVVADTLAAPEVVAGAFRTRHVAERGGRAMAALLRVADLRSRYSGTPYGDQAVFVRAEAFARVGGFPEIPLMEDLELARRLRRVGPLKIARARVRVSGRRFEAAPLRHVVWWNSFPALYALGVPPRVLARLYGNPR